MDFAYNDRITISEFLESMDTKLSFKERPAQNSLLDFANLWVFWSNEQSQTLSSFSSSSPSSSIADKQRIASQLCNFSTLPFWGRYLLIQFWAATKTVGGGCILTTRDQPFALTQLDRGFSAYRNLSLTYTFEVDADEENLGLPGRVFQNKWPESTPDVSYYSTSEYPQRDFALRSCGIRSSLALPVFEPSGCDLLGVLELVSRDERIIEVYHDEELQKITNSKCLYSSILEPASKEIERVLEKVCDAHQLPLAQSWVLGNYNNTPAYNEIQGNGDAMVVNNYAVRDEYKWKNFFDACQKLRLKKDQGIVGKALLSRKPCFCKDITQFSMTDYPLVHYACDCGPVGCFTICLRNFITGNRDYVLEFFLPSLEIGSKEPVTLLNGLLATLKDHFNTFKVASGEELGEELSVQVVKSSIYDESDSFKICQTSDDDNDDSDDHSSDDDTDDYYIIFSFKDSDHYYGISSFKEYMQTRLSCGPRKLCKWVFLTEDDYPHIPTQSLSSSTDLKIPLWIAREEMKVLEGLKPALNEINQVLKVVCERHLLPLVQCWVPWSFGRAVVSGGTRDFLALTCEKFCAEGTPMFGYTIIFRKVQGLVGKTLRSHKPCFCRDITQLSIIEYPFLNLARQFKLTKCFTICLRSTCTGDEDYVLEFFLPTCDNEEPEDPQILLDSLLATMKENFRSFKVASGEELGEETRVEVYKSLNDNEEESFRICQPKRSLSQPEALENEREIMAPDTSDQQLVMKDVIHQDANVFGTEIGGTTCINETSEVEHEKTVNDISYEVLKQHFGRPLKDVAEIFNVSRSTFKRLCRKHGIPRWQSHKREMVDSSSSKRQRVGEEPSRREDMPPIQATSRNVYPVTVKATYKDVIIRFELASSSGMTELQENVTQRLHLEKGNFSIKYQDEEGDWVLIACDNDLKTCLDISRSSKKTPIKMSVGPKYLP